MRVILLGLILALAGCASTSTQTATSAGLVYSDTMEMIRSAAASAPGGVEGEYILKIKAAGRDRSTVYLNTERDYRDQRSIAVSLHPKVVSDLNKKYKQDPQQFFVGKSVSVSGEVKRAKIYFFVHGKRTENYYYQTHIRVSNISQIKLIVGQA